MTVNVISTKISLFFSIIDVYVACIAIILSSESDCVVEQVDLCFCYLNKRKMGILMKCFEINIKIGI